MPQWDAGQYLQFATERTQPSIDLIQRIALADPQRIVDLGCGPGNSTEALRRRWPRAAGRLGIWICPTRGERELFVPALLLTMSASLL
jgi:ubiquinone/menaquinone biosynthesis C-methylase UbiE